MKMYFFLSPVSLNYIAIRLGFTNYGIEVILIISALVLVLDHVEVINTCPFHA
jgi:hypothetical protein